MPDMSANNRHINWAKRKVIQGLQTETEAFSSYPSATFAVIPLIIELTHRFQQGFRI